MTDLRTALRKNLDTVAPNGRLLTAYRYADTRVPVVCLECGRRFKTATLTPSCPKCGGSDIEVE